MPNEQLSLYAAGAVSMYSHLYDLHTVRMTIVQPRLDHLSTSEMPVAELLAWCEDTVKPRAELAFAGEGEFVAGEHCRFCRARFECKARAEHALAVVKSDFAIQDPALLTREQLLTVLDRADVAAKWLSDVQAYALKQAVAGHPIEGWKVVEGRSNRKWKKQDDVVDTLKRAGVEEAVIYERSLRSISALETVLGKKKFNQLLAECVEKPLGKPTLVRDTDKRDAIGVVSDFDVIEAE